MELKKFKLSGKSVEFVNAYRNTRTGFAHDSTLFIDNREYGSATAIYYNRTWECYCYQSVMQKLVRQIIDERITYLKNKFKWEHNYSKLTADRQKELDSIVKADPDIKFARKLLKAL